MQLLYPENVTCLPGIRADVVAKDVSGELPITLYDADVATFFKCDYNALLKNELQLFDRSDSRLQVSLHLKAYDHFYMGSNTLKYSGTYVLPVSRSKTLMPLATCASSSLDLYSLQTLHELTDVEKQVTQNNKRRMKRKVLATNILEAQGSKDVHSLSKALISNTSCEDALGNSTLSIGYRCN